MQKQLYEVFSSNLKLKLTVKSYVMSFSTSKIANLFVGTEPINPVNALNASLQK